LSPSAKSKASGSIYNLFQAIPEQTFPFKKHHEKRNVSSVFSQEFHDYTPKRLRKNFNMSTVSTEEYAGVKKEVAENSYSGIK
jgi:hypothetical protein